MRSDGASALARAAPFGRGGAALALAALALQGCFLARPYIEPLPPEAELLPATTADGWELTLVRYRPRGEPKGLPVLLVHGVVNNSRVLDIDAEHSVGRWLASQGRDTFLLNARGTVFSGRPDEEKGLKGDYTIDTLALQDLPASIDAVRRATGAPKVDALGHSMGGHLLYIYLAEGGGGLNAAATMGAQGRFRATGREEDAAQKVVFELSRIFGDPVPAPAVVRPVTPLLGEVEGPLERVGRNADNVVPATWKKFMANAVDETSRPVFDQMELWMRRNAMVSADGKIDYSAKLSGVKVPTLVVAAKIDHMSPVTNVKAGYDLLGGYKEFFIAGQENGFAHDYGHGDLVMAERAREELWPRILRFFDENSPERQAQREAGSPSSASAAAP